MAVLLLAEVNNGELSMDATAKAVTASKALGDVTVLCAGASAADAAKEAATIDGVAKVLVAAVGSGHPLNIDGIGGGNAVTTKVAMLSKSDDDWDLAI